MAILADNRPYEYPFVWIFNVATGTDIVLYFKPSRDERSAFRLGLMALRAAYLLVLSLQGVFGIPVMV
jgi:hypothetical protein